MTFSSKSPNSWPAAKVRNPWVTSVHLPAWSGLSSAVQPDSFCPPNHPPAPQNTLAHRVSSASLQHRSTRENMKPNSLSKLPNPLACPVAGPAWDQALHLQLPHQLEPELHPAKDPRTGEIRTLTHRAACKKLQMQPRSPRWKLRTNVTWINNVRLSSTQN